MLEPANTPSKRCAEMLMNVGAVKTRWCPNLVADIGRNGVLPQGIVMMRKYQKWVELVPKLQR